MQPQRIVGIALLVLGIALLIMGLRGLDSFSSQVSDFFTGSPTDRTIWLLIGGAVATIAGASALFVPMRRAHA